MSKFKFPTKQSQKTEMSEFICNNITLYSKFMKLFVNKPATVEFITIFTLQNTLHHISILFSKKIISHVLEFIFFCTFQT